jgi:Polyketide cyclase / dehydrase and lipid transport
VPTIYYSEVLDVTPAQAWGFVDAYSRAEVHVFSSVKDERMDGDYRVMDSTDDRERETTEIRELVISTDAEHRRHAYTVEQLFGATHHSASMEIHDENGRARLVWVTDVMPASFVDALGDYYDELFDELKAAVLAWAEAHPG